LVACAPLHNDSTRLQPFQSEKYAFANKYSAAKFAATKHFQRIRVGYCGYG